MPTSGANAGRVDNSDKRARPVSGVRRVLIFVALVCLTPPVEATPDLPLSVWLLAGDPEALDLGLEHIQSLGFSTHEYPRLGMAAALIPEPVANQLSVLGVEAWPNTPESLHLDASVPYIGADRVKNVLADQRRGPTVLVVDTGLDELHPDFQTGNVVASLSAQRSGGLISGVQDAIGDRSGHGSHVAGIVVGSGDALGENDPRHGRYEGVYSNGRMVSFQASTDALDPEDIAVDAASALEAFEWALQNRDAYYLRVVSNSWGSAGDLSPSHPVTRATFKLYEAGMVVVFSAGNDGTEDSLNRHCKPTWVLCVAAGDLQGARADFSSMGPPPGKNIPAYEHPDITAPGLTIRSTDRLLNPDFTTSLTGQREPLYLDRSGTSMAAPHVAGAAALIQAANPDLSPDQVMDILVATVKPMADPLHRVGAGYMDVRAAYNLAIQTLGNREAFLAGTALKYGGPAIGDLDYANDPVSVGYDSEGAERPLLLLSADDQPSWIRTNPVAWALLAVGILASVAGVRWRRRDHEP